MGSAVRQKVAGTEPGAPTSVSELDAEFEARLDRWLSYYRLCTGASGLALLLLLLPGMRWATALGGAYVIAAALVLPLLRRARSAGTKHAVRIGILLIDVATVSVFTFAWGTRASPAVFLYVPIVVGWTLLPRRSLGRLSLSLSLCSLGLLIMFERSQLSLWDRELFAAHSGSGLVVSASRLLFFGLVASALLGAHQLLSYTVTRLREHGRAVSVLLAEKRSREREAELSAQLEETERLEALGRLAGGVAHDFNNLLTALIGCAELAELRLSRNPELARGSLRELQAAAERGTALTAQLLDVASRRPTQPRDVDLGRAVASTAQLLARLLHDRITLQLELSAEPCGARLDPSSVERVLLNLAVNAADAMPEGGTLTIRVEPGPGPFVQLTVQDTGHGIDPSDLPHIFEPFFTRKQRGKGTGLGLASVYGIVKQSQGELDVESLLGKGTSFRIRWPRVALPESELEGGGAEPIRGAGTILLVDDDDAVREVSREHLANAGYTVLSVASGAEALAVLRERRNDIDLLVTDVSMPSMSGIELRQHVRELAPALPVLFISGYAEELVSGSAAADSPFLPKPFSSRQLIEEVERQLQARRTTSPDAATVPSS